MFIHFLKRNRILLVFCALCLCVVALALLELDKQYYQNAKKELIVVNNLEYITRPVGQENLDKLIALADELVRGNRPETKQQLLRQILKIIDDEGNPIYRIDLRDERGGEQGGILLDWARPEKFAQGNTFANSLFLRDFSNRLKKPITDQVGLYLYYTSPRGDERVRELTIRYRWYALFIVLVLTLLAATLARALLIPLNKVLNALEGSTHERTVFSHGPRSRLEALYNRMALGAVISRLQSRLREEITRNPQLTGWEVVGFVCRSFSEQADPPLIACLEMVARGPGDLRATGRRVFAGRERLIQAPERLAERIDQAMPRDGRTRAPFVWNDAATAIEGELLLMADPDRSGFRYLFAVLLESRDFEVSGQTVGALLQGLGELAEAGLQSLSLRNQLVVKERGRANISLSRNLGHDLTNIIATSKLDLMSLDRLLRKGELPDDPRRQAILRESLGGLLKSIRFMQETVNLYRSYSFLQHPVLEIHDGNALINDTLDLFTQSISAKIEIRRELAEDAPRCVVDPRLIKLALFNMFSNSLKAIRKTDPAHFTAAGWIKVITRRTLGGGLCVAVEDSGTGIVDATGQKMRRHEIEKIFELGYSSHENNDEGGEGLGLNWVRTIVQDLHGGTIHAENTEQAGARFVLVFPPIEQAPDMENAERKAKEYMRQFQRQRQPRAETPLAAEKAGPETA